jgi:hypothetical protein
VAFAAARPANHRRKSNGSWDEYRDQLGRARDAGRLHTAFGHLIERDQRLYEHLSFNFLHDIVPIAGLTRVANVMEVNLSVPAKTVPEFIAYGFS